MKFGISFLPDAAPTVKSATSYFADALELAELADRAGLRSVKMTEHYLHPYGGYCPSPLSFLSAVAARTRQIRLMTGCILPAFHHPIQIAAEAAMVDAISGGRVEIGFARAYLPYEFASFGVPLDESRDRYTESIRAVIKLWTETNVTIETPFFSFHNATSLPRPVQKPHPPIWGAAVRSRQSFAWLGQEGFKLLITASLTPMDTLREFISIYRETFDETQQGSGKVPQVAISIPLYVAERDPEAFTEGDHYLQRYLDVWADAADSWNRVRSRDYSNYTGMASAIRNSSPEKMRRCGDAVVGCPEHVIDAIRSLGEQLEIDEILWQVDFGAMPGEAARRTLNMFIHKVLPQL